jgi:hypothetical protein
LHAFAGLRDQYGLANPRELFDRVKGESKKYDCRDVILDVSEVTGTAPIMDMLVLGEHCARVWKRAVRIAIITLEGVPGIGRAA